MISLGSVEEHIAAILGDGAQFCAVSVPDEKKGEAVALLVQMDGAEGSVEDIAARLRQSDLIPLMQPAHILPVEKLPVLASGKADFKGAKKIALEMLGEEDHEKEGKVKGIA